MPQQLGASFYKKLVNSVQYVEPFTVHSLSRVAADALCTRHETGMPRRETAGARPIREVEFLLLTSDPVTPLIAITITPSCHAADSLNKIRFVYDI